MCGGERSSDLPHSCEARVRKRPTVWFDHCFLPLRLRVWVDSSLWVFAQQPCRWTGSRTVLIGYAGEALWHERLLLHDVGNGSWVVLTPDEDMFIEDLSRADSLRICGRNRELPASGMVHHGTLLMSWKCSALPRLRSLSGVALEVILVHAGFCFLVRRPLLSFFLDKSIHLCRLTIVRLLL